MFIKFTLSIGISILSILSKQTYKKRGILYDTEYLSFLFPRKLAV